MSQTESLHAANSEYESLHKSVIISDRLKPIRIVLPSIIIILIIFVICIYTYFQEKNIVENAEQVTNQMAEYIASNIDNEMDYAKASIKFVSYSISQAMTSDSLENPVEIISPMVENSPFNDIEYIRPDGMNIMTKGKPFDASDRVYYIEGIKGNTGVWNNYHPKTSRETLMNFYTPVIYEGKITGVVTGYIAATTQLAPLFETKLYGQDIYGFLVDENDMIICSTIKTDYIENLSLDVFMDRFGSNQEQKETVHKTIDSATEVAVSHKDYSGAGRICVTKIPQTDWKVAIVVPESSFDAIVSTNTIDSIITILIISIILISYATFILVKNIKRRREIAKENAKLEQENRIFNEENKRVFNEIATIRDIIATANMGTWRFELMDDEEPRMYVDKTMQSLLGILGKEQSPEETYKDWFNNISPQALPSVLDSLKKMKSGKFDENTYLWNHPSKGERYVRCGGTAQKVQNGFLVCGYHYDVDDVVREDLAKVQMLKKTLNEKNDYYNTLGTLAGIYNSLHVINLAEDTFLEFSASNEIKEIMNYKRGAAEMMLQIMSSLTTDNYKQKALDYTNLKTLADRMKNKKYITTQLIGKNIGWFLASFITMETDDQGRPCKVIYTTQSIDEEKKQEEKLIYKSRTDELTGLLNRRAYEEDLYNNKEIPQENDFVYMALDLNGLKIINDSLGHAAGDELLIGASQCMKECLSPYGKIYRTGGDEFIATLCCKEEKLNEVLADFEKKMSSWKGKYINSLSISYGFVSKREEPEMSVGELASIADKRMYDAKAAHYRKTGIDRRGQQEAQKALCQLYTKILKINVSDDSYQIVNMDISEQTSDKGFSDKISSWLLAFGKSGQVHQDDLQEYQSKTDLNFIKDYFSKNKSVLKIFYRRKYGDDFKGVIMEIVPAEDYREDNQTLYLYVKEIDK